MLLKWMSESDLLIPLYLLIRSGFAVTFLWPLGKLNATNILKMELQVLNPF